jgi:hypothetical protein
MSDVDMFEQRFAKITELFHDFHGKFVQENTRIIHDPVKIKTDVLPKIESVSNILSAFLHQCLSSPDCTVIYANTDAIITENMKPSANDSLRTEIHTLLTQLCPLLIPWHTDMHARVGHLFSQFKEYPFSINASYRETQSYIDGLPDSE